MALLEKTRKETIGESLLDAMDVKTEIALAKFEQGFVVKRRARRTKQEQPPDELVPEDKY